MIAASLTLFRFSTTDGISTNIYVYIYNIYRCHVLASAKFINYIGVSEDWGNFGRLVEDSIESKIGLLSRDSSYMLVTSSNYASECDA